VLFWGLALAMGCEPEALPRRRRYVLAPEVDAALADATVPTGLCPRRATRGLDLAVAPGCTRAAVAWNGSHYGVAWQQATPRGTAVWFARVQPTGDRAGAAVQVSADGFRVGYPAVVWNGANWSVLFDAAWGAGEGDVQQARVDVRGAVVSAPWRMTRGPRDDIAAAIGGSGQGFGLAWVAREDAGRRHVLYGMSLDRWDAPRGQAVRLIDTGLTLAAPTVTWTGEEWAFTAVSGRGETRAVEFMRLSPEGQPRGVLRHVSPERIGGVELDGRHAIAWDGRAFGLAWSELRDGAQRVFVRRVSARGNPFGGDFTASEGAASAHEPALVTVAPGVFALAFRVERDGGARVSVRTVDVEGGRLSPVSELQGPDGSAGAPAMAFDGHGVGVATVSPRGVAFHRVEFGPCAGSQRLYAPAAGGASPSAAPPYIVSAMR
jgi:hypothetical protein